MSLMDILKIKELMRKHGFGHAADNIHPHELSFLHLLYWRTFDRAVSAKRQRSLEVVA